MTHVILDARTSHSKVDQWICYWSIPVFYNLYGMIYVALAHLMPPPKPSLTIPEISSFVEGHRATIQIGFALFMLVIGIFCWGNGLIAYQMRRMTVSPAFAYSYIVSLAIGAIPGLLFPAFAFGVAALRPGRDPEVIGLLYDAGMLAMVGTAGCFVVQYGILALAIFLDRNEILPRWVGYMTIWALVTEFLAGPVYIFKGGAVAWNGSISFWEGAAIFVVWAVGLMVMLYKAIKRQSFDTRSAG